MYRKVCSWGDFDVLGNGIPFIDKIRNIELFKILIAHT